MYYHKLNLPCPTIYLGTHELNCFKFGIMTCPGIFSTDFGHAVYCVTNVFVYLSFFLVLTYQLAFLFIHPLPVCNIFRSITMYLRQEYNTIVWLIYMGNHLLFTCVSTFVDPHGQELLTCEGCTLKVWGNHCRCSPLKIQMIYAYFHPFKGSWVVNRLQIVKCIMLHQPAEPTPSKRPVGIQKLQTHLSLHEGIIESMPVLDAPQRQP